jgi:hypothetical protein
MKAAGYQRVPLKYSKLYWSVVTDGSMKRRALKQIFRRAREAEMYAQKVTDRWNRLKGKLRLLRHRWIFNLGKWFRVDISIWNRRG